MFRYVPEWLIFLLNVHGLTWGGSQQTEAATLDQIRSVTQSCPTLCDPMNSNTPGLPVHHELPEFTQTHLHRVRDASRHLILCRPLLLLPSIPPSIRVFSNESTLHMRWPKYWSFSFSIIPYKEIPGLTPSEWTGWISLQCKGLSKVFSNTTLQKHQFFGTQLSSQSNSHPYMTTGKTLLVNKSPFSETKQQ